MNIFLQINKKTLLVFICLITFLILFTLIFFIKNNTLSNDLDLIVNQDSNFDILKPKFTINNKQKISIKAEKGNFITDQKILLEKNVVFKSSKFNLQTDKAMFNKKDQTAKSEDETRFKSKKTTIISEGFEITENGDIIFFNGKSKLNIKN